MKALDHSLEPQTSSTPELSNIPAEDLNRLLALRHQDPHSILGAHPTARGVIVRAYRPGAEKIFLIVANDLPREMLMRPEPGLFEVLVSKRHEVFPYQLRIHYPGGLIVTIRPPFI